MCQVNFVVYFAEHIVNLIKHSRLTVIKMVFNYICVAKRRNYFGWYVIDTGIPVICVHHEK